MNPRQTHILIVEDEDMLRINLEDFLEDEGFCVKSSGSGEAALEMLYEESFDLLVADMRLPGIDGNTFVREAKKIQQGHETW